MNVIINNLINCKLRFQNLFDNLIRQVWNTIAMPAQCFKSLLDNNLNKNESRS